MKRLTFSSVAVLFFSILCSTLSAAPVQPATLTIAYEDDNSFPWVFDVRGIPEGLDIEFMKLLEKELRIKIVMVKYPWKRCLAMMQKGDVDGVIGSSFKPDRLSLGAYPTKNGFSNERTGDQEIDETKRMHTSGYSLYRLKGAAAEWDGRAFNHLDGKKIASQLDFTITADMKALGAPVVETTNDPENIFRGLIMNYFAAAAVQTGTAEFLLGRNQEFADKIEKCSVNKPPFHQKPYYLMLSFALIEKYPEFSQVVLKNVEKIRESKAFKARSKEFFQQYMQHK